MSSSSSSSSSKKKSAYEEEVENAKRIYLSVFFAVGLYTAAEYLLDTSSSRLPWIPQLILSSSSPSVNVIAAGVLKMLPAFVCIGQVLRMKSDYQVSLHKMKFPHEYLNTILFGLIFCALGDITLRLDTDKASLPAFQGIPLFILGLVFFLIGHIMFIIAFIREGGNGTLVKLGAVCYGYAYFMIAFVTSKIQDDVVLKFGIVVYGLTIATMIHRALSLYYDAYPGIASCRLAVVGAILFVASDSILAYNKFVSPIPGAHFLILSTYFAAIALITASCAGKERWLLGKDV